MPSLDFTLEQQRILDCTSENIIVSACAGSGKSSTLVEKAKREILLSRPWKKLAVLTFTNKSKDDLISKVNHPSIIITTFHSFIFENLFPFDPQVSDQLKEMFRVEADNYTKWLDILYNKKTIFLQIVNLCIRSFSMKILHIIYSAEKRADSIGSNQFIQISVFFASILSKSKSIIIFFEAQETISIVVVFSRVLTLSFMIFAICFR